MRLIQLMVAGGQAEASGDDIVLVVVEFGEVNKKRRTRLLYRSEIDRSRDGRNGS